MQQIIRKQWEKKELLEKKVESLRKELENLNNTRNSLFSSISNDEKMLNERDEEKNKLIVQKSIKLTDLADKEKTLSEKESRNKDLKDQLDKLKQKFPKHQGLDDDQKSSTQVSSTSPKYID